MDFIQTLYTNALDREVILLLLQAFKDCITFISAFGPILIELVYPEFLDGFTNEWYISALDLLMYLQDSMKDISSHNFGRESLLLRLAIRGLVFFSPRIFRLLCGLVGRWGRRD